MRIIYCLLYLSCFLSKNVFAQNTYDDVAASFELDSITIYAVDQGKLDPRDFIRYTLEDTSMFYGFSLIHTVSNTLDLEAQVYGKRKRKGFIKRRYFQQFCRGCLSQKEVTVDSSGYFLDKKGQPISTTYQTMMQLFTHKGTICNIKIPAPPKGTIILDKPKDLKQQRELIKRFIFAPQSISIDVPFFGNKMKTNIFEKPTSDFYNFRVGYGFDGDIPVYHFDIIVDSANHPNWQKSVLIKSMQITFRADDLAIIGKSYQLYYPGLFVSCDLSLSIRMQQFGKNLFPLDIHYNGEWKFPTQGKDKADIKLHFSNLSKESCNQ